MNKRLADILWVTIATSILLSILCLLIWVTLQEPRILILLGVIGLLILANVLITYFKSTNSKDSK